MDFATALDDEGSRLVKLTEGETADPCANVVYIGPGAIDLLAAGDGPMLAKQAQREAERIKDWRRWDWDRYGQ